MFYIGANTLVILMIVALSDFIILAYSIAKSSSSQTGRKCRLSTQVNTYIGPAMLIVAIAKMVVLFRPLQNATGIEKVY